MTVVQTSPAYHAGRVGRRRDYVFATLMALAVITSVVSTVVVENSGHILAYNDAISHMMISRRTVLGYQPGIAQLGNVWLALSHILMLPFVMFDSLYYSGLAGAVISMAAYVAAVGFIYKILHRLTGSRAAGIVAAVVFGVNANILYMQSTPMTELPLYAALLGAYYFLQVWADNGRYTYLLGAAFAFMCAAHIRYEAWILMGAASVFVAVHAWKERLHNVTGRQRRGRWLDLMIPFAVVAFVVGPFAWLLWNQVLFGDFMAFKSGDYAKPSLWRTENEPAMGDVVVALKTFWYATIENVSLPLLIVAAAGLYVFVWIEMVKGKSHGRSLFLPSFFIIIPFFIGALFKGERPLHVEQINGSLYNIRFGLIMIIPVALFAGYVVALFRKFNLFRFVVGALVCGLALGTTISDIKYDHVVTLNDPVAALKEDRAVWAQQVIDDFGPMHEQDPGLTLIETFGNERLTFMTIPSRDMIYEGTNKGGRWKSSLANPAGNDIKWIVMRCIPGYEDLVCKAFQDNSDQDNSEALKGYDLVYSYTAGNQPDAYKIYKKKG